MANGTFTVGRDCSAVAIAPNGVRIDLSGLTDYDWTPEYKQARSDPLSSPPMERFLPSGHRLKFSLDRMGPANEALFVQIENGWWNAGSADPGTSNNGSVTIFIIETSGARTVSQFTGISMKLTAGGSFKTDAAIKQTIECFAQRKV
jgi:hypothetical protein